MAFETLLITFLASAAVGGVCTWVVIFSLELLLRKIYRDHPADWVDMGRPVGYFFRPPESKGSWGAHGFHLLHTIRLFLWGGLTESQKTKIGRPLHWIRVFYAMSLLAFLTMLGCWIGIAKIFLNLG